MSHKLYCRPPAEPLPEPILRKTALQLLSNGHPLAVVSVMLGAPENVIAEWQRAHLGILDAAAAPDQARPDRRTTTAEEDAELINLIKHNPCMPLKRAMTISGYPASVHVANRRIKEANVRRFKIYVPNEARRPPQRPTPIYPYGHPNFPPDSYEC